jgi:hypothetical protein
LINHPPSTSNEQDFCLARLLQFLASPDKQRPTTIDKMKRFIFCFLLFLSLTLLTSQLTWAQAEQSKLDVDPRSSVRPHTMMRHEISIFDNQFQKGDTLA